MNPTIVRSDLEKILKESFFRTKDTAWSGWRIPIYLYPNGHLLAGGWLSQNEWQSGLDEVYGVPSWHYVGDGSDVDTYADIATLVDDALWVISREYNLV